MTRIDDLFDRLDSWRHLPAYQLERRADIFFALYLPDLLEDKLGFKIEGLVPEFPLRIGTVHPKTNTNQSVKVDYLAKARGRNAVVLVELKTDDKSRRSKQDWYLERAQQIGLAALLRDSEQIVKATTYKHKYRCLLRRLENLGLIRIDAAGHIDPVAGRYSVHVVYVQPNQGNDDKTVIDFHQAADVVERQGDEFSRRLATSLREWADVTAGEPG